MIAVTLWGVTSIGYFLGPVSWPERIVAFFAAAMLVVELPWTDPIGLTACSAFFAYQFWKAYRARRVAAAKPAE